MIESGFIKIYRSLLDWEWYDDMNTKAVFLHLLLTVNIKDSKFRGVDVPRGSRVCSYNSLSEELGVTIRQARTAISHLQMTGEISIKKYPHFSIISIENWNKFQTVRQSSDKANDKATTSTPTGQRQHNKNIKKKEYSLDTHISVSKECEEVMFVGKDVADILGYQNGSRDINRHVRSPKANIGKSVQMNGNR